MVLLAREGGFPRVMTAFRTKASSLYSKLFDFILLITPLADHFCEWGVLMMVFADERLCTPFSITTLRAKPCFLNTPRRNFKTRITPLTFNSG